MQYKGFQDDIPSDREDRKVRRREKDYNVTFKKSKKLYSETDTQKHCGEKK